MQQDKTILIYGAGKIGRSFIGQLFGQAGYHLVFADINVEVVNQLNLRGSYPVVIKSEAEETIVVRNVRAIAATNREAVIHEIAGASIMAVSVGKTALEKVIPDIAAGLQLRWELTPERPLDIIIAENMRSAGEFIHKRLIKYLPQGFPTNKLVGLVETSIGKMAPLMTEEDLKEDPLTIFAEPYNTLILDREGFKGKIPAVKGISPKTNMQAWVDRKAFIHNMGHATAAYMGFFYHPEAVYMHEVLADKNILEATRLTMLQAAETLIRYYPDDFTHADLSKHIEDLLYRFQNQHLKDTVFRVGQDLQRKLGIDDRFAGIIQMAVNKGLDCDRIVNAMAHGFFFEKADQKGNPSPQDIRFIRIVCEQGVEEALTRLCGFNFTESNFPVRELKEHYLGLKETHDRMIRKL